MQAHNIFLTGHYRVDPAARELWLDDTLVTLPPKSFECLAYLLEHRDRAVGRDELISAVWGRTDVSDALLSQTLLRARRAVGDTGNEQTVIRTVPRFGYRWVAPVETLAAETVSATAEPPAENNADVDATTRSLPPAPSDERTDTSAHQPLTAGPPASVHVESYHKNHRSWHRIRWRFGVPLLLLLAAGGAAIWRWPSSMGTDSQSRTSPADGLWIVLPVTVYTEGGDAAWIRLGVMDYIASRLRAEAGLSVLPSAQVVGQLADASSEDPVLASARLRQTTGAQRLIRVTARLAQDGWHILLAVDGNGDPREIEASAPSALEAATRATDVLLGSIGITPSKGGRPVTDPLQELLQRIDAALLGGDLSLARSLVASAPDAVRRTAAFRVRAGQTAFRAGQVDEAATIFEDILHNAAITAAPIEHAHALMGLGAVAVRRRDFLSGERRYAEALASLGNEGPTDLVGNAYNGRGVCRAARGDVEVALADFGRARIALERAGDQLTAASVDTNFGILESNRQHPDQAVVAFDRAVSTFERFGVHDNLAAALVGRLHAELALLDIPRAQADSAQLGTLEKELENATLLANLRIARASFAVATGRLSAAADILGEPSADNPDDTELRIRLALYQKNPAQAWQLARTDFQQRNLTDGTSALWLAVAAIANHVVDAATEQVAALSTAETGTVDAQLALALLTSTTDAKKAREYFTNAMNKAEASGVPELRVRVGTLFAEQLIRSGHLDEATATVGALAHYSSQDFRVAQVTVALYAALHDARQLQKATQQRDALAGERPLDLPAF